MVQLEYGADESYKLVVASREKPYAQLEAKSVYGALHGLQTSPDSLTVVF
ncbi:hypothetical protein DY000_02063062 [Brassica cretica]|uniref:Beta-hexosaminidase eukaryotic type N-terminal domain-containing protein n=1 Tax=Brassica cretica TaxID=69181 RepID=A0ABQ7B3L8_BRACR|nr:hypothetical protein DY000_02063062 [Brassica cretica]